MSEERTTISLSKSLFAEFKRLRDLHGFTNAGFIKQLLKMWKAANEPQGREQ